MVLIQNSNSEEGEIPKFELIGFHLAPMELALIRISVVFIAVIVLKTIYAKTKAKTMFPESIMLVSLAFVIGIIAGVSGDVQELEQYLKFPAEVYLNIFIPLIIFEATVFLNKTAFFNNLAEILSYAMVGTFCNTLITSGFLLVFKHVFQNVALSTPFTLTYSALISAVDPVAVIAIMEAMHVNEKIFNLVFGESTLNDGVAVVLFNLFIGLQDLTNQGYSTPQVVGFGIAKFLISCAGGLFFGISFAMILGQVTRISHKLPFIEPILLILGAMLCYIMADVCLFSGVMAIMTFALMISYYIDYNLHPVYSQQFKDLSKLLGQTCEATVFFDMGIQFAFITVDSTTKHDFVFTAIAILAITVSRFMMTFLQNIVLNLFKPAYKHLNLKESLVLVWSGLRGSMVFALAEEFCSFVTADERKTIIFATSLLILFTIFVQGLTMKPLLKCLKIATIQETSIQQKTLAYPIQCVMNFVESIRGKRGLFGQFIDKFDAFMQITIMKRVLTTDRELLELLDGFKKLIEKDAVKKHLIQIKDQQYEESRSHYQTASHAEESQLSVTGSRLTNVPSKFQSKSRREQSIMNSQLLQESDPMNYV